MWRFAARGVSTSAPGGVYPLRLLKECRRGAPPPLLPPLFCPLRQPFHELSCQLSEPFLLSKISARHISISTPNVVTDDQFATYMEPFGIPLDESIAVAVSGGPDRYGMRHLFGFAILMRLARLSHLFFRRTQHLQPRVVPARAPVVHRAAAASPRHVSDGGEIRFCLVLLLRFLLSAAASAPFCGAHRGPQAAAREHAGGARHRSLPRARLRGHRNALSDDGLAISWCWGCDRRCERSWRQLESPRQRRQRS